MATRLIFSALRSVASVSVSGWLIRCVSTRKIRKCTQSSKTDWTCSELREIPLRKHKSAEKFRSVTLYVKNFFTSSASFTYAAHFELRQVYFPVKVYFHKIRILRKAKMRIFPGFFKRWFSGKFNGNKRSSCLHFSVQWYCLHALLHVYTV